MSSLLAFYNDTEAWTPAKTSYLTWDQAVRFYMSRVPAPGQKKSTKYSVSPEVAIKNLAMFCVDIWEAGDGCPKVWSSVVRQFKTEVLPMYKKYRKGDIPGIQKSKQACHAESVTSQTGTSTRKHSEPTRSRKCLWLRDHGEKLFDILSLRNMEKTLSEGRCFDSTFYEDQKDPKKRLLIIQTMRVRREFVEQQQALSLTRARKYARRLAAFGVIDTEGTADETPDNEEMPQDPQESPYKIEDSTPSCKRLRLSAVTRSTAAKSLFQDEGPLRNHVPTFSFVDRATQTEAFNVEDLKSLGMPQISTRQKTVKKGSQRSTLVNPAYLQSGALMMSVATMSATQAVLAMKIHDETVYRQTRLLPLRMNKKYQMKANICKKYQSRTQDTPLESEETHSCEDISSDSELEDLVPVPKQTTKSSQILSDTGGLALPEIDLDQVEESISQTRLRNKVNPDQLLPDPTNVRIAHRSISTYIEGKIGDEMVNANSSFLMPDGTSRQRLGRIGASLVFVEGKVRALKTQLMGNEKRENWAETLIFQLKRLALASGKDVVDIYKRIGALVSDKSVVNKGLEAVISSKLGLTWKPGHLYCCLHTVLGWQDGIKDLWMSYQTKIGHQKMNPGENLELDMEDRCLVKQVLEAYMRLTADRWSARSWNKFEEFSHFCKDNGLTNEARELHGNRFGDLELCSAIGVYSLETWVKFIEYHPNIRNNLTIFLRETLQLAEICSILWLGAALFGIHVTWPYMNLLLEFEASHTQLLMVLPQLHAQLRSYPISFAQLTKPAIPALAKTWVDPILSPNSPYGRKVSEGLQTAISNCNGDILNEYLKKLCIKQADVLERQRGSAYGFGSKSAPSDAELVTNQLPLQTLDSAPTHTKAVENMFGVEDMILSRFGNTAFEKSTDDLVIKFSQDMIDNTHVWSNQKMRRTSKLIHEQQKAFTTAQRELISKGVKDADAIQLTTENRIQRAVQQCRKSHGGPLCQEMELNELIEKIVDENNLRTALTSEIRYRKFTMLKIKESNPLFKQRNLTISDLTDNLRLLIQKSSLQQPTRYLVTVEDLKKAVYDEETATADVNDTNEVLVTASRDVPHAFENEVSEIPGTDMQEVFDVGEHVAVNFDDGFYIGEVLQAGEGDDHVTVSYMKPKKISTAPEGTNIRQFWFWPSKKEMLNTPKHCIIPLKPVLELAVPPSTNRFMVFNLQNFDFIDRFTKV